MSTLQSGLDDLEREVKAIIEPAGYDPRTLILKASLQPNLRWEFEVLASAGGPLRRRVCFFLGTADDFLRYLRRATEVVQAELQFS
ncbi:hypothetical protein [Hymenobacter siberiensis]|uniref:hypothetical protein n=1 Tax=Hymenobacter siberiensis TaxID=2848396 RepID=UPI001C1E1678|nr:hypothetical protein [Hymenobacter siberiensis]